MGRTYLAVSTLIQNTSRYLEWSSDKQSSQQLLHQQPTNGVWDDDYLSEILSPHCCNAHIWSVDELQFGSVQLMSLSRSYLGSNYNNVTSQTQVIPFGNNGQWEVLRRLLWSRITDLLCAPVCPICIVTLTMGQTRPGVVTMQLCGDHDWVQGQ